MKTEPWDEGYSYHSGVAKESRTRKWISPHNTKKVVPINRGSPIDYNPYYGDP